jgi:hypothetical protein
LRNSDPHGPSPLRSCQASTGDLGDTVDSNPNRWFPLLLQLWIPPAFGCRPEYDNGLEEIVFGFEPWIIVVNLAMPFSIFYRIHAAASLFEVYCKL